MSTSTKSIAHNQGAGVLYECDYYGWIQHNVRAIREGRLNEVDWANVAEELEDMRKSEKRALRSQMARLMAPLLKWSHQPRWRQVSKHSWRATIEHARTSVREILDENPSLRTQLSELLPAAYRDALALVVSETNLPKQSFPALCPWTLDQIMAEDFWPEG